MRRNPCRELGDQAEFRGACWCRAVCGAIAIDVIARHIGIASRVVRGPVQCDAPLACGSALPRFKTFSRVRGKRLSQDSVPIWNDIVAVCCDQVIVICPGRESAGRILPRCSGGLVDRGCRLVCQHVGWRDDVCRAELAELLELRILGIDSSGAKSFWKFKTRSFWSRVTPTSLLVRGNGCCVLAG